MTDTLPLAEVSAYRSYHANPEYSRWPYLGKHIAEHGIQDPVHVQTDGVHALIVDGNKRVAAAGAAGLHAIPVVVDKVEFAWRHFVHNSEAHLVGPVLQALLQEKENPPLPVAEERVLMEPTLPEKASARRNRR